MTFDDIRKLDGTELRYALMELARDIPDAIALGRGDPDLATPVHIVAAAKAAMQRGDTPLYPVEGMPELREAIAARSPRDHGQALDPSNVLITTGGQEGLFLIMNALLDPGDEILVPDPRYSSYDQAIAHTGATQVAVPCYAEDGFDVRADEIAARITPRTKALLLVTPSNPTGGIVTPENAKQIADLARRHDFVVVSDEIYGKFVWEPFEHVSIGALPDMQDRTITLSGFSKAYAMTGWRVGYVLAPEHVVRGMAATKGSTTGAVASVSQHAALAAATGPDDCIEEFRGIYRDRRSILAEGLTEMGLTYGEPRGGFFFWVNSSSLGLRALELSYLLLKEAKVLIFPGTAFGDAWSDYLRITTLQPASVLEDAIERMKPVLRVHAVSQSG